VLQAVLVLGRFGDFNPGTTESSRVKVARILKGFNPKIKLIWCA
jgi:hypothetical protein